MRVSALQPLRSCWCTRPTPCLRSSLDPKFSLVLFCSYPHPPVGSRPIFSRPAVAPDSIAPSFLLTLGVLRRRLSLRSWSSPVPSTRTLFFQPTRFPPLGFHEREGRPYCRRDFLQLFAPRCQGCQGPILDNYISALSALWHPDCFVCRVRAVAGPGGRSHGGGTRSPGRSEYWGGVLLEAGLRPRTGLWVSLGSLAANGSYLVPAFATNSFFRDVFSPGVLRALLGR
jgi:hypothetical protein